MQEEYDFTNAVKNPYAQRMKMQVTVDLDSSTIAYFQSLAEESGIPYQTLIKLYLKDCADHHKTLDVTWA